MKNYTKIFIKSWVSILYKTLIGSKLLRIRFEKIDEFVRIHNGSRYLTLFGSKRYAAIYDRIRYLISLKRKTYKKLEC